MGSCGSNNSKCISSFQSFSNISKLCLNFLLNGLHKSTVFTWIYSSPSIIQPSILIPPLIIRPLDLVPKGHFSVLNVLYFKTTCNIRPHFLGPMGGLKIEGLLYEILRCLFSIPFGETENFTFICKISDHGAKQSQVLNYWDL